MSRGRVTLRVSADVARITIDRPEARNALSFAMYEDLSEICAELQPRTDLVAIVLTGVGGAFAAGTDIGEFAAFRNGADGLAYEDRIASGIAAVERLPATTIALVDGPAMGGGLVLATACDFRIASSRATFGVPIARTLGNMLALRHVASLERELGAARVRRLLLLSEILDAGEARDAGYLLAIVDGDTLESAVDDLTTRLRRGAPMTVSASRQVMRRLSEANMQDRDLIERSYGSADFAEGVRAFKERRKPVWAPLRSGEGAS